MECSKILDNPPYISLVFRNKQDCHSNYPTSWAFPRFVLSPPLMQSLSWIFCGFMPLTNLILFPCQTPPLHATILAPTAHALKFWFLIWFLLCMHPQRNFPHSFISPLIILAIRPLSPERLECLFFLTVQVNGGMLIIPLARQCSFP